MPHYLCNHGKLPNIPDMATSSEVAVASATSTTIDDIRDAIFGQKVTATEVAVVYRKSERWAYMIIKDMKVPTEVIDGKRYVVLEDFRRAVDAKKNKCQNATNKS
jgi:hypothetical protein